MALIYFGLFAAGVVLATVLLFFSANEAAALRNFGVALGMTIFAVGLIYFVM